MCKTLRVLNAVRNPAIGIPLSIQQYKVFKAYWIQSPISKLKLHAIFFELTWISLLPQLLTPAVLIGRLINAHQHLLALRISEYLGMNQVSLYNLYRLCSYDRFVLLFNFILFFIIFLRKKFHSNKEIVQGIILNYDTSSYQVTFALLFLYWISISMHGACPIHLLDHSLSGIIIYMLRFVRYNMSLVSW